MTEESKMRPGERQVAQELSGIRQDHVARYRFAAERLKGKRIVDVGCGVGYGARMLADAGCEVKAADVDEHAIAYGRKHYAHDKLSYVVADANSLGPFPAMDAAVAFEMIEHLEDPLPMLKRLARYTDVLIASVPNELVFPYKNYAYHYRHYTPEQFCSLLADAGWTVEEWWGQAGTESHCEPRIQGRTLVAVCRKSDMPDRASWRQLPPVVQMTGPQRVAIVAMGRSAGTYVNLCAAAGDRRRIADETWAINAMGAVIDHDLLFAMDDCRIQEARAAADPNGNVAGLMRWLKTHPRFFTSKAYEGYPGAIEYPLEDVINSVGVSYLNNTVAYAVAWALHTCVKSITLHGCDYSYPNLHKAERGRGCVEFLLGMAAARGVAIEVAQDSSLLDANVPDSHRLYGFDAYDIRLERQQNGRVVVHKTERETLPTAAEIEQRYCHVPQAMPKPKEAA